MEAAHLQTTHLNMASIWVGPEARPCKKHVWALQDFKKDWGQKTKFDCQPALFFPTKKPAWPERQNRFAAVEQQNIRLCYRSVAT